MRDTLPMQRGSLQTYLSTLRNIHSLMLLKIVSSDGRWNQVTLRTTLLFPRFKVFYCLFCECISFFFEVVSNIFLLKRRSVRLFGDWMFCVGLSTAGSIDEGWVQVTGSPALNPPPVRSLIDVKQTLLMTALPAFFTAIGFNPDFRNAV